jgi:Trypsin-like peptidase domain
MVEGMRLRRTTGSGWRTRLFGAAGLALCLTVLSAGIAAAGPATPGGVRAPAAARLDPQLFARLASGVVLIRGFSCSGTGEIEGTGFLVGANVVMTARHVVDPSGAEAKLACHVKVHLDGRWVAATRIAWWYGRTDPTGRATDLATLKLAVSASPSDTIFDFRNTSAPAGTNLAMIGHPLGTEISLTQGKLLGRVRYHTVPLMVIRMLGAAGSSGSPIVDNGGHVVGVLQLGLGGAETSGLVEGIDLPSWWGSGHKILSTLCRAYPKGGVPGCATTTKPPPPPTTYTIASCWLQAIGDGTAHLETAVTTVAASDLLAAGPANYRIYYQLSGPAPSDLAASLTLDEPNGTVFATQTGTWQAGITYIYTSLDWTSADGTFFFQNPSLTGQGQWSATVSLPNGATCTSAFSVT